MLTLKRPKDVVIVGPMDSHRRLPRQTALKPRPFAGIICEISAEIPVLGGLAVR
jgi:hypothetical protein